MAAISKPTGQTGRAMPSDEDLAENAEADVRRLSSAFGEESNDAAIDAKVQERINAMLPDLMAKLVATMQSQGAVQGAPVSADDRGFVASLALQLAELTGQGTGRIYVAPEIVETRRRALGDMRDLLVALRAQREMPAYALTNKVQLNLGRGIGEVLVDHLYRDANKVVQTTEIDWPGIPNMSMRPINEAAERVYALFLTWTGSEPSQDQQDEMFAVTSHGAVIRGRAAGVILRNDKNARQVGDGFHDDDDDGPIGGIRKRDTDAPKQRVQVFGTLTKPVEVG